MRHLDRITALLGIAILGAVAVLPPSGYPWGKLVLAGAGMALAVLSLLRGSGVGAAIPLVAGLLGLGFTAELLWQLAMAAALTIFLLASSVIPRLGPSGWWRLGTLPWLSTAVCAAVTPVGLVAWVRLADPDLSNLLRSLPQAPLAALILGGMLFALVNAIGEELIWRGLFQHRLVTLFGPAAAIAIQGISFGIQHTHGFPSGATGVLLAGAWGVMLGWLRWRSRGVLAPILAHLVADATIAAIVLVLARG
ncbi:MAG: CPBP family intramembrane metalloprotease [Bradymonadales bacterium]|nr:CPBP family intramembrane metalloprotease [Bradymonadales bacterium]